MSLTSGSTPHTELFGFNGANNIFKSVLYGLTDDPDVSAISTVVNNGVFYNKSKLV